MEYSFMFPHWETSLVEHGSLFLKFNEYEYFKKESCLPYYTNKLKDGVYLELIQ